MAFEPPPGYVDMLDQAEESTFTKHFHPLDVDQVGVVKARKPMPNAVAALAMAANSSAGNEAQVDYLVLFVRNHIDEGELDRLFLGMMRGELPANTINLVSQAVATWGTARPT